jgi:hypothetical protein
MSATTTISLCNRALEAVRAVIPADLHGEVSNYIDRHNEWGVGMETLIDGLSELKVRISTKQFALIEAAVASMDLAGSSRLNCLRDENVVA